MKRKKKYRLRKARILLALIIFISTLTVLFNFNNITNYISLKNLNYSNNTIKLINKNELEIDKYSKTLDNIINTKYYIKENTKHYLEIDYKDNDNFLDNINKLLSIGYNSNEINTIYNTNNDLELILNSNYNNNITSILNSKYYKEENFQRYFNYNEGTDIVLEVNMYLDYDFYEHEVKIDNIDNLVIVNKYYKLDKSYVPTLVKIDNKYAINERQLLTSDAKEAFEKMCEDARSENIYLYSGSAYRSYDYQNTLYNNRVKSDGLEYANKTAAKAGHSEHQTGLALDILNKSYQYLDEDDIEYKWLIENSYKYGFILRYPKNKDNITGYTYEPWHFRYINVDIATILKEKNITYEEYIGMNL